MNGFTMKKTNTKAGVFKNKKFCRCMLCLFLSIFVGLEVFSAESSGRTVRVGYGALSGYHEQFPDGGRSGYGYEYLQRIAGRADWKCEYIGYDKSWVELLAMLERGEIDLLSCVNKTPERERKFAFSENPIGTSFVNITVKAGNSRYYPDNYAAWAGIHIGMVRGNQINETFNVWAKSQNIQYTQILFDSDAEASEALQTGKIDALVSINFRRMHNEWLLTRIEPESVFFMVSKNNPKLLAELDCAQTEVLHDNPLLHSQLSLRYYSTQFPVIVEDRAERFAENAKRNGTTFSALIDPDRSPLVFLKKGKLSGIQYGVIRKLIANSGIEIRIIPCRTHEEYLELKKKGQFDIILDARYDFSQAETDGFLLCNTYLSTPISILQRKNRIHHSGKIALLTGSNLSYMLLKNGLAPENVIYFPSIDAVVEAVKNGSVDSAYLYTRTCNEIIRIDLSETLSSRLIPYLRMEYALAVNRKAPRELFALLNHATAMLSPDDIQDSFANYELNTPQKSSLADVIRQYPRMAVVVMLSILIFVISSFGYILLARRKLYRNAKILKKLPLRFFVADRNGKLLLLNTPDLKNIPRRTISELAGPDTTAIMKKCVDEAFKSGSAQVDYVYGSEKRSAATSLLPASIFGRETVVWISQDTTALHDARAEAVELATRMRLNLKSIGDGVIGTDAQGCITLMNPAAEMFCGITEAEAYGKKHEDCFNIVNYETGEQVSSPVRRVLATGETVELANHTDLIALDGTRRHIADCASPIPGPDNSIHGTILVFRDVTDEYNKRDRIREMNESFRIATDMSRVIVFCFNTVDRTISGVTPLEKFIPVKDGKLAPFEEWVLAEDIEGLKQYTEDVCLGKIVDASNIFRSYHAGVVRTFRCFLRLASHSDVALIGVMQEITEYVEQENLLTQTQQMWGLIGDTLPVHLFAKNVDDNFHYVMANKKFANFVGKTTLELIGKTDRELFPRVKDSTWFEHCDNDIVKSGTIQQFQETVADVHGQEFQMQTIKTTCIGPGGKKLLLGVSMDITEQMLLLQMEHARTQVLEVFFSSPDIQTGIGTTLKILSECNEAVFCCVLKRKNEETLDMELFSECRAPNIPPVWTEQEDIHFEPEWCGQQMLLHHEGTIHCPDLDLPSKMSDCEVIKKLHRKLGIKAVSLVGIYQKGVLWGELVIAYQSPHQQYGSLYEVFLCSFAHLLEMMIARSNMEYRLRESLTRLELAAEIGQSTAFVYDIDQQKISGSRQLSRFWPQRNGQFIPYSEWVHPDYLSKCNETYLRLLAGEKGPFSVEVRTNWFGKRRFYAIRKTLETSEFGGRLIVGILSDITDPQGKLLNEQHLHRCLEILFNPASDIEAPREVLKIVAEYMEASWCKIVQINREEHSAQVFTEYYTPKDGPRLARQTSQEINPEWEIIKKLECGELVILDDLDDERQLDMFPLMRELRHEYDSKSVFMAGIFIGGKLWGEVEIDYEKTKAQPFTDNQWIFLRSAAHIVELLLIRKQSDLQLKQALTDARSAAVAKSNFLATMSHEIRTPLNSVIGFSELLKDGNIPANEQLEYLNDIATAGNALLLLLNDVLDLSRLEAGQMNFVREAIDFPALIKEIENIFKVKVMEKKISLCRDIKPMPILQSDKQRLRQILFNLVGNAIKFTEQGMITIRSEFLSGSDKKGTLRFSVEDTGCGIAKVDQERIFQPFVQSETLRGTRVGNNGSGLGLAIIRTMLEKMNGKITIESSSGKGSIFTVEIDEIPFLDSVDEVNHESVSEQIIVDSSLRVLLVDDISMNLKVMAAMCRKIGLTHVDTAKNGNEALDKLAKQEFDLVLTDLWMPDMNGVDLSNNIRANKKFDSIRIFAITADVEAEKSFDVHNFNGILMKPISLVKLMKLMELKEH